MQKFLLAKISPVQVTENQLKYQLHHLKKLININAYPTDEEILPSDQGTVIEQAKFTYSLLEKKFRKIKKKNWRSKNKTGWSFKSFKTKRRTRITWKTFSKKYENWWN